MGRRGGAGRRLVAVVGVLVGLLPAGLAAPVAAQDGCGEVVVDETGRLDPGEVRDAAADVGGATVRVRFYSSTPAGLDEHVEELIATCWPGPGGVQADLLLLAVSLGERRTVLRWGGGLDPGLEGRGAEIRDEVVNDRLREGDLTGAAVAGLAAVDAALAAAPPEGGAQPGGGGTASTGDGGGDGGGGSPLVPLGALAGLLVVGGGVASLARSRRLNERRRHLDVAVEEPLGRAGDLRERGRQLELRCSTAEHLLAGASLARLDRLRATARDAGSAVDARVVLLRQATPEGIGAAGHDQLELAEGRVAELVEAVAAHDRALSDLDRALRRLDELRTTLPAKRELLDEELGDARALAAQRRDEGWRTDGPVATLDRLEAELAALDLAPLRLDLDGLSQRIEQIEADLFAARHELQTLPERRAGLEAWAEQLVGAVELERQRALAAAEELRRLATIHDPASLAALADAPAAARAALDRAEAICGEARSGPLPRQGWDEAGRLLEEAGLHLCRADAELDEVDRASVELNDARARSGPALARAVDALEEVERFVAAHDEDLGPRFDTEPAALRPVLGGLAAELRRARPNHLRVLRTAEQAVADLQRLMDEAQDEQGRVAALRRQVEQEVAWAVHAVARAHQALGWQLLPSGDAHDLALLEESLEHLPEDLEARITAARSITEAAQRIELRIVSRRRRGGVWIVGGPVGGAWGGGLGGGSGGSGGSWGGGGFGGGSFGGGGFGGGSFGGGGFGGGGGGGSSW